MSKQPSRTEKQESLKNVITRLHRGESVEQVKAEFHRLIKNVSPEEISTMEQALPFDITYVDEHDKVRYYSGSEERIFPRSPAVIGRDVQNCHPQKSVETVNRILQDFREKKQKAAEFWIDMHGRKVHIRYFPVYNESGEYRGVIEVTQDITVIQKLDGERRLLDWRR